MGAMGTFEVSGADGTYPILVDRGSTHHKDENRNGHVNKAFSHRGNGILKFQEQMARTPNW
jgi:hypothetical protein